MTVQWPVNLIVAKNESMTFEPQPFQNSDINRLVVILLDVSARMQKHISQVLDVVLPKLLEYPATLHFNIFFCLVD